MICGNRYFWCVFDVGWQILTNSVCQVWRFPGYLFKYRLKISNAPLETLKKHLTNMVARFWLHCRQICGFPCIFQNIRTMKLKIHIHPFFDTRKCQTNRVARFWQRYRQICRFLGCHLNYLNYKPKKSYTSV